MKKIPIFVLLLLSVSAFSQDRAKFLYAEFSDKSITIAPFYKVYGNNFDPVLTLGAGWGYWQKGNFVLFQTAQITGYLSEYVIRGVNLTTSLGYGYHHGSGVFGELMAGIGGGGFTMSRETFVLNGDNVYEASRPLNLAVAFPFDLRLGYNTGRVSFYLKYRYVLMGPYVENLPLLPLSQTGLGMRLDLQSKGK